MCTEYRRGVVQKHIKENCSVYCCWDGQDNNKNGTPRLGATPSHCHFQAGLSALAGLKFQNQHDTACFSKRRMQLNTVCMLSDAIGCSVHCQTLYTMISGHPIMTKRERGHNCVSSACSGDISRSSGSSVVRGLSTGTTLVMLRFSAYSCAQ